MEIKCPKCNSRKYVKNGIVFGWQRYKCKDCGYQFTKPGEHGKSLDTWLTCHGLYMFGLSMRQIARIVGLSAQTISRWIRKWHQVFMHEIGSKQTLYSVNAENVVECLGLNKKDNLMVSSTHLKSGAEIHILIKLPIPSEEIKSAPKSPSLQK